MLVNLTSKPGNRVAFQTDLTSVTIQTFLCVQPIPAINNQLLRKTQHWSEEWVLSELVFVCKEL